MSNLNKKILSLAVVIAKTRLSRSSIYSLINKGQFPKQIKLSERSMGFLESEVDDWLDSKIAARDAEKIGAK